MHSHRSFLNNLLSISQNPSFQLPEIYYNYLDAIHQAGSTHTSMSLAKLKDEWRCVMPQIKSTYATLRSNPLPNFSETIVRALALLREVCLRTLDQRPYDSQILAGLILYNNSLAEMQTGEGKTLAAVIPAILKASTGHPLHLMTFNDYLAQRDAEWMKKAYKFCDLEVACIQAGMSRKHRRQAYSADIVYGTAKEMGFDYLRDQMVYAPNEKVLPSLHHVLIDEADALLIDEARNPLILAGDTCLETHDLHDIAGWIRDFTLGKEVDADEYSRNIYLTESGIERIQEITQLNLFDAENYLIFTKINLALHARFLLNKDIDYLVREGRISLIDEFTGRIIPDRKWRHGLQNAVEAKEGLTIGPESTVLQAIPLQYYINLYPSKAAMTGTAR